MPSSWRAPWGAAELLDYPREAIRGLVLEDGAITSHVVIVARAMGIPVVGQVIGIASLAENRDPIIVDGEDGIVHLRPISEVQSAYADKVRFRAKRQEQFRALRKVKPRTRDGQDITLQMNAGLLVDLPQLKESGASGIGLFRTELQFMIASTMPKVGEQESLYRNVLRQAAGRPVTFRTLDIGGDKVVPYFPFGGGGKPGTRLASHQAVAGSSRSVAHPVAGAVEGRSRHRAQTDAADGHRGQ